MYKYHIKITEYAEQELEEIGCYINTKCVMIDDRADSVLILRIFN